MKKQSHKKDLNLDTNPTHVEPMPIPIIKEMYYGKSDKYFIELKLCKDPISSTLDLYDFKMSLFDHGEPEEFLLFIHNFNMTLAATWVTGDGCKDSVSLYASP